MAKGVNSELVHVGRAISTEDVALMRETVELFPGLSRTELAQTLCDHLGWYTASGMYKDQACLNLLERLEAQGLICLPKKRPRIPPCPMQGRTWTPATDPGAEIRGGLSELGDVRLTLVESRREAELVNEYVSRYHYLGYKPPAGCRLRYLMESARGRLGCLVLGGAARAIAVRDHWIGWTRRQRLSNLAWVVNNTRFLVFPWVGVPHLASHVLGQLARRLASDWQARWGYRPVLLETFVDPAKYRGTSYQASGWELLGQTTGEGLARPGRQYQSSVKLIYVRPLVKEFRQLLCSDGLVGRQLEP